MIVQHLLDRLDQQLMTIKAMFCNNIEPDISSMEKILEDAKLTVDELRKVLELSKEKESFGPLNAILPAESEISTSPSSENILIKTRRLEPIASPNYTKTRRLKKLTPPPLQQPNSSPIWLTIKEVKDFLGLDDVALDRYTAEHGIRPMTINGEKMFSHKEISFLREQLNSVKVEPAPLSSSQLTVYFQNIQEQGHCFLVDTKNSNYDSQDFLTLLGPKLKKSNTVAVELLQRICTILKQRDQLFAHTIMDVEKEIESSMFWELCQGQDVWERWSKSLLESNCLARYYCDLVLMRLVVIILKDWGLPKNLCDLVPRSVLELADNVVWPPKDLSTEQRVVLRNYLRHDKIWFILDRLCNNNPLEFDLDKITIPEIEESNDV